MKAYTLAHPLDAKIQRGSRMVDSPFTDKDLQAGDLIELEAGQAQMLGRAGYLNLDASGRPLEAKTGADVPPRGGEGSGRDPWAEYADSNGVPVTDDMQRDDIIAALDAAGIATHRAQ